MCINLFLNKKGGPGAPLTYFNDEGGGQVIFGGVKFWPKMIFFWSMKDICPVFWGVAKKGLKDFFEYAKKVVIFMGRQILKL